MKEIQLTKGKIALVDDEDAQRVSLYSWYALKPKRNTKWYARGAVKQQHILMHRYILNVSPDKEVDHINGDTLDNQKENLRICNRKQNCGNYGPRVKKVGYKGVYLVGNRWRVILAGKHIGYFSSETEAALTYNKEALAYFGEFAFLNVVAENSYD